jgi:arylsulfatase A-like enzyme
MFKDKNLSVPENWVEGENEKLPTVVKENARGVRLHLQRYSIPELYQKLVRRFATQGCSVDDRVGFLIKKLLKNTIIIYTSDNGRFQGSHGLFDKCLLYKESIKAPLIIYDGRVSHEEQGFREKALISSVDMASTILSFAGIEAPKSMQGRDFRGLLNKTQDMSKWRDAVFMEDLFLVDMFSNRNKEDLLQANKSYRSHSIARDRY